MTFLTAAVIVASSYVPTANGPDDYGTLAWAERTSAAVRREFPGMDNATVADFLRVARLQRKLGRVKG